MHKHLHPYIKTNTACVCSFVCRYSADIELEDAIHTAILTLREGFEGALTEKSIEIGVVGEDRKFRVLTPAEIRDYLNEVEVGTA